jgi:hypothetical protein
MPKKFCSSSSSNIKRTGQSAQCGGRHRVAINDDGRKRPTTSLLGLLNKEHFVMHNHKHLEHIGKPSLTAAPQRNVFSTLRNDSCHVTHDLAATHT